MISLMSLALSSVVTPTPLSSYLSNPGAVTHLVADHIAHLVVHWAIPAGGLISTIGIAALFLVRRARRRWAERLADGARLICVLVPPDVDPDSAKVFWSKMTGLLRPSPRRLLGQSFHLSFEMTASSTGLSINLWVPGGIANGLVESAIEAAWPGALAQVTSVSAPLPTSAVSEGGSLVLADQEHYPLATDHDIDPLRLAVASLAATCETDTACVQVLARPVTGRRLHRARRAAASRRSGRPMSKTARLVDLVLPGPVVKPVASDPTRASDVAAITAKIAQPCFAVEIHYGVSSTDADCRSRLRGHAGDIASSFAVFSGRNHLDRRRLRHCAEHLSTRQMGKGDLMSVTELAALAHLPFETHVAGLARAGAKAVAPPPEVTSSGKVLGDAETGSRRTVALAVPDARYHAHVLGATGSGKSTLLTNMILGDIADGRGVIVIDPKGDLVTDVLEKMGPTSRACVIIDPEDTSAPPIMNVLDATKADHDLVVDNVVGIFRKIFEAYWGPRTDDVLRASCLTLLRHGSATATAATLADVPRLLTDGAFRAKRVAHIGDNASLKGFWDSYEAMSEANRAQVTGPVMNKLRAFLLRDFVSNLMGPAASSFSMDEVLNGGVCLVRIPKGLLGEETCRLLGSFVLAKVWQAATHRAGQPEERRLDAALYVDECQNFLTLPRSFDEMLAEARGYRLSLVLAHQHMAQLSRELREAISANARSKIYFSVSPEDAHVLSRHVDPTLTEHDLSHLAAYQAACRLVVGGAETPAFTMRTRPAPLGDKMRADVVRDASRERYGRSSKERADNATPVDQHPSKGQLGRTEREQRVR